MAGRLVKTGKFPDGGYTISLRSLPAGGYQLEMMDETGKKAVFPFEKI
jgi:hypothetical protein